MSVAMLTLFSTVSRAQTTEIPNRDAIAIRSIIADSQAAFEKRDLNGFASYFLNSPKLYYQVMTGDHQVILAHGFENMKKMVGGYMQNNPKPATPGSFIMTDQRIRVMGNVALLTGDSTDSDERSQNFIVLEKVDGTGSAPQWKISALTAQYYEAGKRIEIK